MDGESLRVLLGQGLSVEKIARRFGKNPATVAYWMKKHGLESSPRSKYGAKGGIERERLEELVERGLTIAAIAEEVGLSKTAVRHWLKRFELQTQNRRRRRRAEQGMGPRAEGLRSTTRTCIRHGDTEFVLEGRGYYRCKRCRAEGVAEHRRRLKQRLVDEAGGGCAICGYKRYLGALAFHHVDPAQKRLQMSWNGVTQSLAKARQEAAKCVLLCSNCHAEVEAGIALVPAKVDPLPRISHPGATHHNLG
jgi:transposase-like protein